MNLIKIIFFIALFFSWKTCFSNQTVIECTNNVLQQIYPNQNACVLQASIPSKLRNFPFVIYPTQVSEYNTERFNFNKRFNIFPKAIMIPESESTLVKIFNLLVSEHLNFSIRSGGHCFEPGSLSSDYILDLKRFNTIKLLNDRVYIGAGVRLGPVIEMLGKEDRAIPTGTCQSVGIAGLTLGGGLGFLSRTFGLTSDALKSITLLTANNQIIEVDENNYSDLFWALQGAGNGSYGIALGFTFKTVSIPSVSYFELKWNWDPTLVPKIFAAWQKWIPHLPDTINPSLEFRYSNGEVNILLTGLKVGNELFTEWEQPFKDLNPTVHVQMGRYADIAALWADSPTLPFAKIKSIMAFKPISDSVLQKTIDYLEQLRMNKANFIVSLEFVALGGKLSQGESAFFPRKASQWWHQVANWNQQEQELTALDSLRQFYNSVSPFVSNYCYSNDVDYDLGDKYLEAYYGDHVERLIQIKNKYDPHDLFHWKQSIPTSISPK